MFERVLEIFEVEYVYTSIYYTVVAVTYGYAPTAMISLKSFSVFMNGAEIRKDSSRNNN